MSDTTATRLYESKILQKATGDAIRPGGLDLTSRALEFCDFLPGSTILDIGCGLGATQTYLTQSGYQSYGIDISQNQLLNTTSSSLFGIQANAESVPFRENSMDGVFIECTLSVVNQPERVLTETCRLLKPGGLMVLTDIYARNIYGIPPLKSALSRGCFNSIWSQIEVSTMVHSSGLNTILWEDHIEAIRTITGKIIFDQGSMKEFWQNQVASNNFPSVDALNFQLLLARAKISYFLLIAQKPV